MFDRVIVGVDGREGSRAAVALGRALASGRLTLVSAYPHDPARSRGSVAGFEELQRQDTQRALEGCRFVTGVEATLRAVPDSSPARALQEVAEEVRADLIVVGSAHHGAFGRLLLGDVGRGVLNHAPCPVAIAPKRLRLVPLTTVGVGYDGTPEAAAALELAARIAGEHHARLVVLTVWETPVRPADHTGGVATSVDLAGVTVAARETAQARLDAVLADLPAGTEGRLLHGVPATALAEAAGTLDLLVVGSRGWGTVRRVVLGSTADRLAHSAPCPLVVVPRPVTAGTGAAAGAGAGADAGVRSGEG